MRGNLTYYVQKINDIVTLTEQTGEEMNPFFETLRGAIDEDTLSELTSSQYEEIKAAFAKGTAVYEAQLAVIKDLRPPARVLGIHKKLEKAYSQYVLACQSMVESITDESVDVNQFNESETKQDAETDTIAFCIQRMTQLLLK
ncbi:hypothetical protein [Vagococcus lutrae]|uniref:hypothetical protein n=1 Tax=Vagococcus lutrae TaxID=81947 RepID=UPI00200E6519|nr:hypothetical protein [Vagococcus lutrae]UQF11377.1 hypothetical protein M2919_07735 [Vagococcus lutrae]